MKPARTISGIALGCPKNLVDSEGLVGTLVARGFRVLRDPEDADLVLVNTCGFLAASREESLQAIREAVALKSRGVKGVMVTGCMVGQYKALLDREAPGVDRVVGFQDYQRIDRLADEILPPAEPPSFSVERRRLDVALTPAHFAYLKISEGCNHTCSFCVIPSIRGPMASLPTEDLVTRARALAARGVKEVVLIAQDSTSWGADLYGRPDLPALLRRLDRIEGLAWLRLMYAYPTEVKAELAEVLASGERLLRYLDVPVQHASDRVLRAMRRGYGRADLERMLDLLRGRAPDMALRTTVIVGFPGETDEDFETLSDFVREARFDRLGAFRYSREEGSRADGLEGHVPEAVKDERFHHLMALQQGIAFEAGQRRTGTHETVLVDAPPDPDGRQRCRSVRDAPEVDAAVFLSGGSHEPGTLIEVEITAADGYDLLAVPAVATTP